jgi:uncharacterized membrane protein
MSTTATEKPGGAFASDLRLVLPPKSCPAGDGVTWIAAGWRLFVKSPLMFILSILVLIVLAVAVNFILIIGPLAFQILNPVFAAGFVVACRSLERGGEFEIEHLFAGFKSNFASLAIVGVLFLAGWVAILLVVGMFAGMGVVMAIIGGNASDVAPAIIASGMALVLGMLVMLALMVPLLMAYWFAPALVIMHGMAPVAAMRASFWGCLRNIVPFLVYGIIMTLLAIVAVIPFGLGMLVWVPLAITSTYAAYRAIYTEEAAPGVPAKSF